MVELIQPKEFSVIDMSGIERHFILSKFPAVQGREIIAKYPTSALPKIGDYQVSEEVMLKLMNFVAVQSGETQIRLSNRALVDNHVGDWETLAKIEMAMMEYNCSFFQKGRISDFFQEFVPNMIAKISGMLTDSLAQSSQAGKPPSTN